MQEMLDDCQYAAEYHAPPGKRLRLSVWLSEAAEEVITGVDMLMKRYIQFLVSLCVTVVDRKLVFCIRALCRLQYNQVPLPGLLERLIFFLPPLSLTHTLPCLPRNLLQERMLRAMSTWSTPTCPKIASSLGSRTPNQQYQACQTFAIHT